MLQPVYGDIFRPTEKTRGLLYDAALIIGGSLVTALAAQISITLPFTPVPITGQTFAVLLIGALLGSKRGAASMVMYMLEGIAGLPFFAGPPYSVARLIGPTGGYLIGFIAAAFVVGWLAERGWDRKIPTTALAMIIGNLVIYVFGVTWLGVAIGFDKAIAGGLLPFIPGDLIKIALATGLLPAGWALLGLRKNQGA